MLVGRHRGAEPLDRARQWIRSFRFGGESSTDDGLGNIDARTLARVNKAANKIVALTKNPRLNLKNSPPYLQGIMLDVIDTFTSIFEHNALDALRTNEYLSRQVDTFLRQAKRTLKLFKDAREAMEDDASSWRRELSKYTLVLSHLLTEFRTYFKDGVWSPDFRIVKIEAREFWDNAFGKRYAPS